LSTYAGFTRRLVLTHALATALLLPLALPVQAQAPAPGITVFAAASLTDTMKAVADAYQAKTGTKVTLSFGGSNTLAQQIDQGANADIFMSADPQWMDFLAKNNRIAADTRHNLLGNRLVLIGGSTSKPLTIAPHMDLAGALAGGRLALADPNAVPAGIYGKAALTYLAIWDSVADKIASADNVRAAMQFVSRGEAPYGIVYETDARVDPGVHVVAVFPESTHPAIVYPVALTKTASPAARDFLAYVSGPDARAIFEKAGFTVLN
jgi:molybdate transport system substrate-binding protein